MYSARKWMRLATQGNVTVLLSLHVPDDKVVTVTEAGRALRANGDRIASKWAASRFLGYMSAQRRAMTGERGTRTNRPELVTKYG